MTRRQTGAVAVVAGVLLSGLGIADLMGSPAPDEGIEAMDATTTVVATVATSAETTTAPTTTTTAVTTTTIVLGAGAIEAFVEDYRAALDNDDVAFLFDWLHPGVKDGYGSDLCREWVAREIAALEDYELTGPLVGPSSATISTESGTFEVDDLYSGPISFVYQGATFEGPAQFAVQDGSIYWLGICR
ncbi:MAG TPA: hypothetical protein VM848_17255 [Acidimicrobiia bacterium]|nr:hypothetical protein [Acidimicrobiia bacterium]